MYLFLENGLVFFVWKIFFLGIIGILFICCELVKLLFLIVLVKGVSFVGVFVVGLILVYVYVVVILFIFDVVWKIVLFVIGR